MLLALVVADFAASGDDDVLESCDAGVPLLFVLPNLRRQALLCCWLI